MFGGNLKTSLNPSSIPDPQKLPLAERFQSLGAALAAARSQAPIPSASGAFRFAWDPEVHTFVRSSESLGSILAERAQTLGQNSGIFAVSYTHIDFDTLEGDPLDSLVSSQPALSKAFLKTEPDRNLAGDDLLQTRLNVGLTLDLLFFTAGYGITDDIDVSLSLSVNRLHMSASADAQILYPPGKGKSVFVFNQPGALKTGLGPVCSNPYRCAKDGFDDTAFGTGDLFLRTKWHFYDAPFVDLAAAGVLTLPTGNADDFLGFHNPTFTPRFIASKNLGRVSPHLNLGYSFRSSNDGDNQGEWIAGADFMAFKWLTLNADFLGFHDDNRDGINDDVLQSAVGFRLNPFGQVVIAGNFQFPLNRDGLRADVIYTGQVEYTF